jgi:hypothetical protein
MKRFLPLALGLFLCHCGTEVGNGVAPEPKATGASNGSQTSAPEASEGASQDHGAPVPQNTYGLSMSFIAACASPFAESIEGTFVNATGSTGFTVTVSVDGKKTVSRLDNAATFFVITTAPTVGPYAIAALSISPNVTCGTVTTQTLSDGSVQRSVTLSDGVVVQWILSAGKVISMKMTNSAMSTENWTRK